MAIKLTPNILIIWVSNIILKGIAELTEFSFDLEARKSTFKQDSTVRKKRLKFGWKILLFFNDGESYRFIIHQAKSDRPWLNNLLSRIIGKAWKIPAIPQLTAQLELLTELLKPKLQHLKKLIEIALINLSCLRLPCQSHHNRFRIAALILCSNDGQLTAI